jgi:hypothetical protein
MELQLWNFQIQILGRIGPVSSDVTGQKSAKSGVNYVIQV